LILLLILLPLVVATTISFSQRDDMTCQPQDRLVGWGEVAADRALVCDLAIEVDGLSYHLRYEAPRGCVEVDEPFLGNSIALSEGAAARTIVGVPRHVALALAFPDPKNYQGACVGWHLWQGSEITIQDERALKELACRVVPRGKPDPESCLDLPTTPSVDR
jgi:hypothetical protein